MILVDANILLYAHDAQSQHHQAARAWWDGQLSGVPPVGLCWSVIAAFIRIGTNARVIQHPMTLPEAIAHVQNWRNQRCARMLEQTDQHWKIFQQMLIEGNAVANLVTDAHLAALAVEHNCMLCTNDADFSRFPGLKWRNPLKQ